MTEIARTKTIISLSEAAPLLVNALGALDMNLTRPTASYILALAWNETGGGKVMNNYNWGNISGEYQGNFFRPAWYEITDDSSSNLKSLHEAMLAGKVSSKFRAYDSHADGLSDFLRTLYRSFPSVVRAAGTGDAYSFANAIYQSKYCPDPGCRPEKMANSYQSLANMMSQEPALQALPKGPSVSSNPASGAGSSSGSPHSAPSGSSSSSGAGLDAGDLPTLRRNSHGSAVALWQALLGILPVDGKFGSITERDTVSYQRSHSYDGSPLVADGIVGKLSWLSVIEILRRQHIVP
jgi:peptidoglycan hydrolase-like protein with peptidoglycan-binding domain